MSNTQNMDIASYVRRIRRFRYEMGKSSSGNVAFMKQADADRMNSYVFELRRLKEWFMAQPELDLPESHGSKVIDLGDPDQLSDPENESIKDIMELLLTLEHELVNSQSSRMQARLISHDSVRVDNIVSRIDRLLNEFIMSVSPIDLPESSPLRSNVGDGRGGLNL